MNKMQIISTIDSPILEQNEPITAIEIYNEFIQDKIKANEVYTDNRLKVTGVVRYIGLDVHNKPSLELSDKTDGKCYVLCVFNSPDTYDGVTVGDRVTCMGNYLEMYDIYGVVLKKSELI